MTLGTCALAANPGGTRRSQILRQLGSTFAAEGVVFSVSVLISILLSRGLKPEGRGEIAAVMNSVSLAVALSSFSLGKAFLYSFNRPESSRSSVVAAALAIVLPLSLTIGAGALLILAPWRTSLLGAVVLIVSYGLLVLQLANEAVTGALRATKVIHSLNAARVLQQLARLVPAAALFVAGALTARRALWVEVGAAILAFLLLLSVLVRDRSLRPAWHPAVPSIGRELVGYGVRYLAFSFLLTMHIKFDVLLINWWRGHREAGVYATSVGLADLVSRVPTFILFVLSPHMAEVKAENASAELCARITRHVVPLFLTLGLSGALVAPLVVPMLYGHEFLESAVVLQILLPGTVMFGLFMMMASHWVVRGRLWALMGVQAVGLAINLALNTVLIPAMGGRGAALASVASYSVCAVVLLRLLNREGVPLRDVVWPRPGEIRALVKQARLAT